MYCPRCGQQQISDEMKFCSRCGLAFSGLSEWLAAGGWAAMPREESPVSLPSPRRKGIRRGAKIMFLGGVLFPILLVFSLAVDEGAPMVIPFILLFVGLVIMLYARLFSEKVSPITSQPASGLGPMSGSNALPPASNVGMHGVWGQQVRTSELAEPPSVTERTTRLLDNE